MGYRRTRGDVKRMREQFGKRETFENITNTINKIAKDNDKWREMSKNQSRLQDFEKIILHTAEDPYCECKRCLEDQE